MNKTVTPTEFFKSLSDETRLNLILLVKHHQELCVCEFTDLLTLSQPKISRHLALLRSNCILSDHRKGKWVYYRINQDLPDWCLEVIDLTFMRNRELIEPMLSRPVAAINCNE
ncbi:arsenical resistance operon repressor [Oceanospirillum sp. MED92]|uniref:Arsenical resistance operon repressor n=1 Tax=Neptuniibacter caesariensis TaxID=207954 RepID=A0A7U8GR72_NEPCE|nr:metalloregulator ArsR/SmtB family transcription factor [Neptuniibacter caesariensis]EAR59902.1 arsenical resistance operon repressor [Oceanospirillum sp. MED92] [Neptuniibacter caesariensis]